MRPQGACLQIGIVPTARCHNLAAFTFSERLQAVRTRDGSQAAAGMVRVCAEAESGKFAEHSQQSCPSGTRIDVLTDTGVAHLLTAKRALGGL